MKKINIGYFADGPWAHNAFNILNCDERFKIAFICVRYNSDDFILKKYAEENKIPLLRHQNVNSMEFLGSIEKFKCDIFVSMSFNQILKKNFIEFPPLKTINCHAGKLPFYRGRNILNWALINDEKEFGITVHYVDEGIDTGDIILQKTYLISDEDDYSSLLSLAYKECAIVLYEALVTIYDDKVQLKKQHLIHPIGFYCIQRKEGDEIINWNSRSREIFNFIRAICKPGPMARSRILDNEIKINKVELINNAPEYKLISGAVVGKDDEFFFVKTKDTLIKVVEYEYDGKIKIGDRLN